MNIPIAIDTIILLIIRLPIIYLKAAMWTWFWRKIFKKDKFESMEAVPLTLPPLFIGIVYQIYRAHLGRQTNILGAFVGNIALAVVMYFLLQREKKVSINVAGRLNTPEYKRYSDVLGVPHGRINTDKLIEAYMSARRKASNKEERELVEIAYLYFTDYKEYKKIAGQQKNQQEEATYDAKESEIEEPQKAKSEKNELEDTFRKRMGGRY